MRCGGGANHRMGLGDAALIKDNHVRAAAGGVAAAIAAVRAAAPGLALEVECDTLEQVRAALDAGAGLILLDNMGLAGLGAAAGLRAAAALAGRYPAARLEASGGLRLEDATAVAATGVNFVAVGALHPFEPGARSGAGPAGPLSKSAQIPQTWISTDIHKPACRCAAYNDGCQGMRSGITVAW